MNEREINDLFDQFKINSIKLIKDDNINIEDFHKLNFILITQNEDFEQDIPQPIHISTDFKQISNSDKYEQIHRLIYITKEDLLDELEDEEDLLDELDTIQLKLREKYEHRQSV